MGYCGDFVAGVWDSYVSYFGELVAEVQFSCVGY